MAERFWHASNSGTTPCKATQRMNTETKVPMSKPETGDMKTLRQLFGIPRTTAYELNRAGEIRFISLRKRGNRFGRTLVDFDSVRAYLDRCKSGVPDFSPMQIQSHPEPLRADSHRSAPEFGGFRELQKLFGIGKKRAYALERAGKITIIRDRKRGAKMCRVSIDFESVRRHLAGNPSGSNSRIENCDSSHSGDRMRYTEVVPAPKLMVRRSTLESMVESTKIVEEWISSGRLQPVNPGDGVLLYLVKEVEALCVFWVYERRNAADL